MDSGSIGDHEVVIDDVQQEIITDGLVENQIELSTQTSTNDLSALATAAEFVPLLEEAKQEADKNIESDNSIESQASKTENGIANNNQLNLDSATQDEETLKYDDVNEESVSSVSATTTPGEYFMTSSYEEMVEILNDYFERTLSRFVVQKKTKNFGLEGMVVIDRFISKEKIITSMGYSRKSPYMGGVTIWFVQGLKGCVRGSKLCRFDLFVQRS